jgi:hypothetical protein
MCLYLHQLLQTRDQTLQTRVWNTCYCRRVSCCRRVFPTRISSIPIGIKCVLLYTRLSYLAYVLSQWHMLTGRGRYLVRAEHSGQWPLSRTGRGLLCGSHAGGTGRCHAWRRPMALRRAGGVGGRRPELHAARAGGRRLERRATAGGARCCGERQAEGRAAAASGDGRP